MKRIILFLMICVMLLSGCITIPEPTQSTTVATMPPQTTAATEPTQTEPEYSDYEAPMLSLTGVYDVRSFPLMDYRSHIFELLIQDPQVSEAVTLNLLNITDFDATEASRLLKQEESVSFQLQGNCQRLDSSILSLLITQVVSTEDGRPNVTMQSATYDLVTGNRLKLKDILLPDYSAQVLTDALMESLSQKAQQGLLYSDYAYVVSQLFTANTQAVNWYFSSEGLCFYFSPYEIAPYNLGFVTATIPYEALTGTLRSVYFPSETVGLMGKVICQAGDAWENFSQFRELTLDPNGKEYQIFSQGAVENFRMEYGTFTEAGFISEGTVFASTTLCPQDVILLQLNEEQVGKLLVTYLAGGELVSVALTDLLNN